MSQSQVGSKIFSRKTTLITFYVRNKKHLRERNNQKCTTHNKRIVANLTKYNFLRGNRQTSLSLSIIN